MDITDRFAELVRGPEERCQLDLGALLIAAHARRDLDVDAELRRLDELAAGCPGSDVEALTEHLCGTLGFRGDTDDYSNPRNSLLDVVVDRRLGIPISLSIVVLEVGRRLDIPLQGVGMPGHFLVRDAKDDDVFVDPFHQMQLDRAGCETLFTKLHGSKARFEPRFLQTVGPRAVMARMLTNLQRSFVGRGDRAGALWSQCLRVLVPGATVTDRRQLAAMLAANGRFDSAAQELEAVAEEGIGGVRDRIAAMAMRAKLN
ncbi:MAG TPA: transglutaminase-like domain-containing protein [Acidimicrobiales bacterium]|nr:transglutaminase-like domain-containing protein [Acidimicrobiales bacterium]